MTKDNFSWLFNLDRIHQTRRDEGAYLLRTNMTDAAPSSKKSAASWSVTVE